MSKLHVKTGDTVVLLTGDKKDRKKTGKVLEVSPKEGKVIVEGLNMVTKHVKPRRQGEQGGIVKAEGAIYACKVMPVCPKCGKPTKKMTSRTGKVFYGCSGYPECKFMSWDMPTGKLCPQCGEYLVNIDGKIKCSNKKCKYEEDAKS